MVALRVPVTVKRCGPWSCLTSEMFADILRIMYRLVYLLFNFFAVLRAFNILLRLKVQNRNIIDVCLHTWK